MVFDNLHAARRWFRNYKPTVEVVDYVSTSNKMVFGDWFLFQHVIWENKINHISRPILGIFNDYTFWDQALVINFIEGNRAWANTHKVLVGKDKQYDEQISFLDPEVQSIPLWHDDIKILGHWRNRPTLADLRIAIGNVQPTRDDNFNIILNDI